MKQSGMVYHTAEVGNIEIDPSSPTSARLDNKKYCIKDHQVKTAKVIQETQCSKCVPGGLSLCLFMADDTQIEVLCKHFLLTSPWENTKEQE